MSYFVDQYTKEIDQTKFDMEKNYEEKLNNEKRIAEEANQVKEESASEFEELGMLDKAKSLKNLADTIK